MVLYGHFNDKLYKLAKTGDVFRETSILDSVRTKRPIFNAEYWNKFIDNLGCTRIIRSRVTGWEYEDDATPRSVHPKSKTQWKSINAPGYVHVGNPIWRGGYDKNNHIIRVPKDVADRILLLGLP